MNRICRSILLTGLIALAPAPPALAQTLDRNDAGEVHGAVIHFESDLRNANLEEATLHLTREARLSEGTYGNDSSGQVRIWDMRAEGVLASLAELSGYLTGEEVGDTLIIADPFGAMIWSQRETALSGNRTGCLIAQYTLAREGSAWKVRELHYGRHLAKCDPEDPARVVTRIASDPQRAEGEP